jgi:predicted AAA+ superfamily ATPase
MILRAQEAHIRNKIGQGKAIVMLGARQTGKTTLLNSLFPANADTLHLSGDEPDIRMAFEHATSTRLKSMIGKHRTLVLDEAQRIKNIGLTLKLITDHLPEVQLVATGSSAFELSNELNEPLTGRKWEFRLFPVSFSEMAHHHGTLAEKRLLPQRLVFGYYPEVVNQSGNEREILKSLTDSYLYKDILLWERVKKPDKLLKLLQALAYQVGNQVSYHELGQLAGIDNQTVENYITLLEQMFVIFRLGSFSKNLRNELKHSKKIYFYDNGIRNALIANFALWETRTDQGPLWENFLMAERQKVLQYDQLWRNGYYWRTQQQQEIDYVEVFDGKIEAYECKVNPARKPHFSLTFRKAYPEATTQWVNFTHFEEFVRHRMDIPGQAP